MRSQTHWLLATESILLVVLAISISSVAAFFVTSNMAPTDTATSSVVVSAGLGATGESGGSVLMAPQIAQNYATLARNATCVARGDRASTVALRPDRVVGNV